MEFKLVGKTTEGIPVVGGLYDLYQTFGIPLSIVIEHFENKGWVVSPFELACEMYVNGVKRSSIANKVVDGFERSPEWKAEVTKRIEFFLPKTED